jgi:glycosyltransferase involved in cell wall biosynthesis/O-antigen/teichoic acid export membrane protein
MKVKSIFTNIYQKLITHQDGLALIVSSMLANIINFIYNSFLGRHITLSEFGTISVITSIVALIQIPLSAYSRTVGYKSAFLNGKYGGPVREFWLKLRAKSFFPSIILTLIWVFSAPILAGFYKTGDILPFILVAPLFSVSVISSVDSGYVSGSLKFSYMAIATLAEVLVKLIVCIFLVSLKLDKYIYISIPISGFISFAIGWILATNVKAKTQIPARVIHPSLSTKFMTSSIFSKLSTTTFMSIDLLLAKHTLSPEAAGQYALLSLAGKIVYFFGTLITQFVIPLVSHNEGAGRSSHILFKKLIYLTLLAVMFAYIPIGIFGFFTVPLLFGHKAEAITKYLPIYALAMAALSLTNGIVAYHQSKKSHLLSTIGLFLSLAMIGTVLVYHDSILAINQSVVFWSFVYLAFALVVHKYNRQLIGITRIPGDFISLFISVSKRKRVNLESGKYNILILNWRDTKHVWSGGAENYIHEIAKRWVLDGHRVTVFCGNDAKHSRYEIVDKVEIYRRGGFYMVYIWAFAYYLFRLKSKYDVVIDAENGIPFFSPLYAKEPVILLIHHVHQNVFRKHLIFPFSYIAMILESKLMPLVYRHSQIITISESSKNEIQRLNISKSEDVNIVNPGINISDYQKTRKTPYPSIIYLGRLRPNKNIELLIKAFALLSQKHQTAKLTIAGEGICKNNLMSLTKKYKLESKVIITGKVTEKEKIKLLGSHWIMVQPSLFEGWGITVIEANACNTPVIAAAVNGLKDSVVHGVTGLLFDPKSVNSLILNMELLINNSFLRHQLARQAYIWSQKFSWDESADKFLTILSTTIEASKTKLLSARLAYRSAKL